MRIQTDKNRWYTEGDTTVRGCCWDDCGEVIEKRELAQKIETLGTKEEVIEYLKKLNGLYGIIINRPELQLIAVDKTRIYPIFYRTDSEEMADLPQKLRKQSDKTDKNAVSEYLSTGAPLSGKTLVANIRQVKPAHAVIFGNGRTEEIEIYNYAVEKNELHRKSEEELYATIEETFKRLTTSLNGRQVVVPLSGGYDSRLILCMLKKLGYEKIITYTVGPDLPDEQNIAKCVAEKLNVPIYHIDYRIREYVMQEYDSEEFNDMIDYVGAYGNFLWLFEYNAIKWLERHHLTDNDAVFIPGHSGDFIAGSHLKKLGIKEHETVKSARNKILLNSFEYHKPYRNKILKEEVGLYLENLQNRGKEVYSAVLDFILKNRLAHQINNSARVYEYMGYDVRLPLWDYELTELFRTTSYEQLFEKKLYDKVVEEKVFIPMNVDIRTEGKPNSFYRKQYIRNIIKQYVGRDIYLRHKGTEDKLGEEELTRNMVEHLVAEKIMRNPKDYISQNEIMMRWYLDKVEKEIIK